MRISKFGKDHITGLASGKGGRLASDSMIEFASPNYKDATYGNSNNRDPYYEFGGISGQVGESDKIVISASILPMDYGSRRVIQSNAGGNWINPVAFEVDGTINIGTKKPGQQDLKIKYIPGKWYELTTVLTPGSRDFDFYINGEKIDTSTVQIGENDKVVACPDRIKFGHSMQSATGSSYTYFDNFHVYVGDYDPAPSRIEAGFQTDDRFSVNETDKIITITGDITVGQLKSCINTDGAVRVYTNSDLATQVADDQLAGTYILLITSANERGTELYTMLAGKTNIKNAGGLEFDNGARTITVMPDTPVEKLTAMIETYGAVVSVVDQDDQPATGYVTASQRLKLADPADASSVVYYTISLKDKLFSENFDNYSERASYGATGGVPSGFFFGANKQEDGNKVYVEGVEIGEGNRAVKFHSENAANDYQISVEKNFDAGNVNGTVVVETSIRTNGALTDRMITNRGVYVDGKTDFFSAFINLDRNGNIVLMGRNVGKYVNDRWYRFVIVYDMDTNIFKGFIDGVQVYQGPGTSGMITSVINIRMQQNTIAGAAASETYFDDFRFYNVYNTDDFDTSGITTEIKASQYRVVPGADPSLRAAWNQKTIADIFSGLEISGADYYAEDQNGTKLDGNTAAANGIRIVVKSADGLNVAKYTLDDSPYYAPIIFTDGTDRIYKLGDGTVKAVSEAQIFTEDSAKTATLVIAQYEGDRLIKVNFQSVSLEAGAAQPLEAALNITAAGTKVKGMLLTDLAHLIPLCTSETIS